MNRNNQDIEELRTELDRLILAADNIERLINAAQEEIVIEETNRDRRPWNYRHTHPVVYDNEGVEILIGDQSTVCHKRTLCVNKRCSLQNIKQW